MGRMSSSSSSLLLACTIHYYLCYRKILSPSCLFFMKKKTPVALFKECWQLFKESNRGLHSLRSTEQRPGWKQNLQISSNLDSYKMCHLILGWIKVSYSSWLDSKTRNIKDSRTAAIICHKVCNFLGNRGATVVDERWQLKAYLLFAKLLLEKRPNLLKPQFLIVKDLLDMQYACFTSLLVWTYYMY